MSNNNNNKENSKNNNKQRALVLQGGGSLGAYEAGAFKALHNIISKEDEKKGDKGRPLFDIIAGTSIGAINAAILSSHVIENKSWEGSAEKLIKFWLDLASWDYSEPLSNMFDYWSSFWGFGTGAASSGNNDNASNMFEPARKYYTSKFASYFGVPTVFSPNYFGSFDTKYFDNFSMPNNMWFKFDPTPLKKNLEKACRFPIKANEQENHYHPRLITISTDVLDGATVVFDSYKLKSTYPQKENPDHTITYENGLLPDHIMASASVPINYEFTKLKDDRGNDRYLWDGALLSNTPLTELLLSHHDYWWKKYKNVPDLESVYMINVNPTKQETLPQNRDEAVSRCFDILLSDKTRNTEDVTIGITNLVDLIRNYRELIIKLVNNLSSNLERGQKNQIVQVLKKFYLSEDQQNQKTSEYRKGIIERISFEIESEIHQALKKEIDEEEKTSKTTIATRGKEVSITRGIVSDKEKDRIEFQNQIPEKIQGKLKRSRLEELINQILTIEDIIYNKNISNAISRGLKEDKDQVFDIDKYTFRIDKIIRIERTSGSNDVANKAFDFSARTIKQLIDQGYKDTMNMDNHIITR